jgi:hypothetical protein
MNEESFFFREFHNTSIMIQCPDICTRLNYHFNNKPSSKKQQESDIFILHSDNLPDKWISVDALNHKTVSSFEEFLLIF